MKDNAGSAIDVGDRVRVRSTPATVAAGIADRTGVVHGWTTPSLGYADDVIGDPVDDRAFNVKIDGSTDSFWLAGELVEYVDHGPGMTAVVGGTTLIRQADGSWTPVPSKGGD